MLGKVWRLFLGRAPQAVATLQAIAPDPAQTERLAKQTHALKSMCLSAGAARMAAICEAMESSAKAGQLTAALEQLPGLAPGFTATEVEMLERLETRNVPAAMQG